MLLSFKHRNNAMINYNLLQNIRSYAKIFNLFRIKSRHHRIPYDRKKLSPHAATKWGAVKCCLVLQLKSEYSLHSTKISASSFSDWDSTHLQGLFCFAFRPVRHRSLPKQQLPCWKADQTRQDTSPPWKKIVYV